MATVLELAKLLGYAFLSSVMFMLIRNFTFNVNTHHATGFGVIRAEGYSVMIIGFFMIVLGFILTRINLVAGPDGRPHFTLS